jgi:hypothetical protein
MLTAAAYPTASDRDSERTLMVAPRAQDLEELQSRDDEPTSVERNPVTQPSRTRRAAPRLRRIRRLESAPKMVLEVEDDSSSVVDLPVPDLAAIEVYRASHLWTATAPVATRADVTADRFEATVISKRTKRPVRPVILAATAGILVGLSLVCGAGTVKRATHSITEILLAVCQDEAPDVRTLAPWTSPSVAAVVGKALRRKPDDRFASAREMLASIRAFVGDSLGLGAMHLVPLSAAPQATSHVSPTSPHMRSACPGPASCLAQSTEEDTVPIRREVRALRAYRPVTDGPPASEARIRRVPKVP